jgi:glycosyltransferase involved in cell wall biosynthesis
MKVLHICKVYLPTKGGIQVVVDWLASGLKTRDWQSTIFSTSSKGSDRISLDNGVLVNSKSYAELFSLPVAPGIIGKIWRHANRFDVVCVHYPFPLADVAIALLLRKKFSLLVYWHSEIVSQKISATLLRPFTKRLLNRADAIVCSSPLLISHSKLLSKIQSKCVVIPFGMPVKNQPSADARPSLSPYLLFIGRHVPYKGIDFLLTSYAKAFSKPSATDPILKIVGSGPLLIKHKKLATSLKIVDKVEFLVGVNDTDLEMLISHAKCLVLPSVLKSEAFGLVQIEAMAKGRPIINTSLESGVPWVARHELEAITVEPDNVDQLSSALIKISSDNTLTDQLGANALKRFEEVFQYSSFCNNTDALYRSLIERRQ